VYIYTSEKVMSYVYRCEHKFNNTFYIGYRYANTIPSNIDIVRYKTSSKFVKPRFNEFNWVIIAEFFNPDDAYKFEQEMIASDWNNPLLLNQWADFNKQKRGRNTEETRFRKGSSKRGKATSDEIKKKISISKTGIKDQVVTCPRCGKTGGIKNMHRYHFDNCNDERKNQYLDRLEFEEFKKQTGKTKRYPTERKKVDTVILTCPYCNKSGGHRNMKRYHFDNCKILAVIK